MLIQLLRTSITRRSRQSLSSRQIRALSPLTASRLTLRHIFEFEVEPQNGAPAPKHMTASTSMQDQAGETVSFGKITFNEDTGIAAGTRKTYEYIVREKEGANPSVEYDGREVKVTVTVTKNEQNELEAVANYEEAASRHRALNSSTSTISRSRQRRSFP